MEIRKCQKEVFFVNVTLHAPLEAHPDDLLKTFGIRYLVTPTPSGQNWAKINMKIFWDSISKIHILGRRKLLELQKAQLYV